MRDVLRRIAHVKGRHREILELHAFGGLSDEQIAHVLGIQVDLGALVAGPHARAARRSR